MTKKVDGRKSKARRVELSDGRSLTAKDIAEEIGCSTQQGYFRMNKYLAGDYTEEELLTPIERMLQQQVIKRDLAKAEKAKPPRASNVDRLLIKERKAPDMNLIKSIDDDYNAQLRRQYLGV